MKIKESNRISVMWRTILTCLKKKLQLNICMWPVLNLLPPTAEFANHTIRSGYHKTACGPVFKTLDSEPHLVNAQDCETNLAKLRLKIVLSSQGSWAWLRFISLMPQNLRDVKKALVMCCGITNIQFKYQHYQKECRKRQKDCSVQQ